MMRWFVLLQAKYAVRLLQDDGVDAAYVAHPSFVDAEELAAIKRPLSIAAAGEFPCLALPTCAFHKVLDG